MQIDKNNPSHIIAEAGYEFMRKSTGERVGTEVYLGFIHYINGVKQEPPHQDVIEDFEEVLLPPSEEVIEAREKKLKALSEYDSSPAVNSFVIAGKQMWLDPLTRANYLNTVQGAQRMGISEVEFLGVKIAVEQAIRMLDAINLYAMQCVAVTERHRQAIEDMRDIASIEAYDYTQGYPERLEF